MRYRLRHTYAASSKQTDILYLEADGVFRAPSVFFKTSPEIPGLLRQVCKTKRWGKCWSKIFLWRKLYEKRKDSLLAFARILLL